MKPGIRQAWLRAAVRGLPPRSAGASLKQDSQERQAQLTSESSPAFCGGLIEAAHSAARAASRNRSSPAFCGGLIEAGCRAKR